MKPSPKKEGASDDPYGGGSYWLRGENGPYEWSEAEPDPDAAFLAFCRRRAEKNQL